MCGQAEQAGAATTFCVDGRVAVEKNPVRYINAARTKEQLGRCELRGGESYAPATNRVKSFSTEEKKKTEGTEKLQRDFNLQLPGRCGQVAVGQR